MESNEEKLYFDLEIVRENFKLSKKVENDIDLEFYLKSFEELNRFFFLLGTIFGFVSSELEDKISILKNFLSSPDVGQHFSTVKSSRTLLRLHRGFEFIQAFLKGLIDLGEQQQTSTVCHNAYTCTLANHHSFLIRTAAKLAMYNLPVKHKLLVKVCGSEENIRKAEEILPETLEHGLEIYNIIQKIYEKNNLLSLP
ncbi:hypothetical protein WA026_008060 [Henosepilachna vigintioctopunctata]|uniref:Glycolipid transfer protein domain-containing protein n=1 Tax=Henosepilachna vigintioctopunctata TaxID=420089 RepID=A0AAW1TKP8_9CUCU